jgi:hypothetical protein
MAHAIVTFGSLIGFVSCVVLLLAETLYDRANR